MKTATQHNQASSQDDLTYLSELGFDQLGFDEKVLNRINHRVDARVFGSGSKTVFISLCCIALVSITFFSMLFNRSQNQPSTYQAFLKENNDIKKTHQKTIRSSDTITAVTIITSNIKNNHVEPFKKPLIVDVHKHQQNMSELENLTIKQVNIPFANINETETTNLAVLPNAPCVFISDLKVANYKEYYFKQNQFIDLDLTTGLSSQYENESNKQKAVRFKNSNYYAHVIIQQAMALYHKQLYANSIGQLQLLYNYNPDDVNAQFYIAMGLFEQKQFANALPFYNACLANSITIFYQEAEYYKAICLLKTNQVNEAKKLLLQIKTNHSFYSERATLLLESL